mmetsp:Transcript_26682/g.83531  ORF Transcript_26682/g.83531 Transcript_26682/m.83531 type:complete len:109 (+) Transcript_26682:294-620(+)
MSSTSGYIGALIAVFCYGSNFIPVKKIDTGDGLFYQVRRAAARESQVRAFAHRAPYPPPNPRCACPWASSSWVLRSPLSRGGRASSPSPSLAAAFGRRATSWRCRLSS